MTDNQHWIDCIRALFHDPADKALDVKHHESRTLANLAAALAIPDDQARHQEQKEADWLASACERLPLPKGTLWKDGRPLEDHLQRFNRIKVEDLERCNSVTGRNPQKCVTQVVRSQAHDDKLTSDITAIRRRHPDERLAAYALWRLIPKAAPEVCDLPGDTRLRDHSITDHVDATAAACAALREGKEADLLVFSLGPVQGYISQGRSLRDLWSGSYLLSWLTFRAMEPLLNTLGPWSITSPGLRGNPLCDWWLGQQGVCTEDGTPLQPHKRDDLRWAGIPNTFTAVVPRQQAGELCSQVRQAALSAWHQIAEAVHGKLLQAWGNDGWDHQWPEQCREVWDIRCVHVPFIAVQSSTGIAEDTEHLHSRYQELVGELPQAVVDAGAIAEALGEDAPRYVSRSGQGLWTLANELAQRVLEADKRARRVPRHEPEDAHREKCALIDGFSVMGPCGDTQANHTWWKNRNDALLRLGKDKRPLARIRTNERLSAPGLVKRFAFDWYFHDTLGKMPFPDTREAAMAHWVQRFSKRFPDQWQHFKRSVARINDASEEPLDDPWTACELLDPSRRDGAWWNAWSKPDYQQALNEVDTILRLGRQAHEGKRLADPRPYYAVLVADGDKMGDYLRGHNGPSFAQAYHPEMSRWLQEAKGVQPALLDRVRPQGMAAQLAFSSSLNRFTIAAGRSIAEHDGTCVYAGGDDVLAIVPVTTCLQAAAELAQVFKREVGGTLSAGIAVVHSCEDLRMAIRRAREAEADAKTSGRDGLSLTIVRRSGDTTTAYCPWSFRAEGEQELTRNLAHDWQRMAGILAGQSDRWIHHLLGEQEALRQLPLEAVWARAQHLLLHGAEGERRRQALVTEGMPFPELLRHLQDVWADTTTGMQSREGYTQRKAQLGASAAKAWLVDQFITWCQHAAWLARFQDQPSHEPVLEPAL